MYCCQHDIYVRTSNALCKSYPTFLGFQNTANAEPTTHKAVVVCLCTSLPCHRPTTTFMKQQTLLLIHQSAKNFLYYSFGLDRAKDEIEAKI